MEPVGDEVEVQQSIGVEVERQQGEEKGVRIKRNPEQHTPGSLDSLDRPSRWRRQVGFRDEWE